jgi:hypothetical protein
VNKNRLLSLLTKYFNDPNLNILISTMLKCGVIEDHKVFFEKVGVPQGSVLAPFLFNIYMHEFDLFMESLIKQNQIFESSNTASISAKEYDKIFKEFHASKAHLVLKKYGSPDAVRQALTQKKKEHYKKYHRALSTNIKTRSILYVRYADDFLIGIVGPKKFAIQIKNGINGFIKSSLHLQIKKDEIINRNERSILFLGFLIKLPTVLKQTRIIPAKKEAILRYKKRSIARMSKVDLRIAKSFRIAFVKSISQAAAFQIKQGETISKQNMNILAKRVVSEIDFNQLPAKAKSLFLNIKYLKQELNKLDNRNIQELIDTFEALPFPDSTICEPVVSIELLKLKNQYLEGLRKIQNGLDESIYQKKRKLLLNRRKATIENQKKSSQIVKKEDWKDIYIEKTIRLADSLTHAKLNSEVPRLISINAPIMDIINKLRVKGFFHPTKSRCSSNRFLVHLENYEIVNCYSQIMDALLNYYAPVDNFSSIKNIVIQLKQGCAYTIAHKHNKNKSWVYLEYGQNCTILDGDQKLLAELPSENFISQNPTKYPKSSSKNIISLKLDEILSKYSFRLYQSKTILSECAVKGCTNSDIEIHNIQKLHRKKEKDGQISVFGLKGNRIKGIAAILTVSNRKQIPLCRQHHLEFQSGKFTKLDRSFLKEIYNTSIYSNQILQELYEKGTSDI